MDTYARPLPAPADRPSLPQWCVTPKTLKPKQTFPPQATSVGYFNNMVDAQKGHVETVSTT